MLQRPDRGGCRHAADHRDRPTNYAADNAELLPLIDRATATLGHQPPVRMADAGYRGEASFRSLRRGTSPPTFRSAMRCGAPSRPNPAHVATQRMAARLASDTGRARYRRRKAIVEPVLGWIKEVLGFRRFMMRGLARARGEWNVVCLAVNLKRLHRIQMG